MKRIIPYLAVAILLCSCDKQPLAEAGASGMMKLTASTSADTRVAYDEGEEVLSVTWRPSGEAFSLFQGQKTNLGNYTIDEGSLIAEGKTATFSGPGLDESVNTVNMFAIYPPISSGTALSYPVTVMGQKGVLDENFNYMFANFTYKKNAAFQTFAFKHITVILKLTLTLPVDGTLGNVTLSAPELRQSSNFSANNGGIGSAGITKGDIVLDGTFSLDANRQKTVYVYLLPSSGLNLTLAGGLTVKATVAGKEYSANISRTEPLVSGTMYKASVTLK